MTSVGSLWTYRDGAVELPSLVASATEPSRFGWETEVDKEVGRCVSGGAATRLDMKLEKIAFAASRVGSSLFAAGVPVLDRDRLVDFPKEPVSGTFLRDRVVNGLLSLLSSVSEYQSMLAGV